MVVVGGGHNALTAAAYLARAGRRVPSTAAFAGTLHVNESYTQLARVHDVAVHGGLPEPLPCEAYCHTLTDPTILAPDLAASGAHTLTVFGVQVPAPPPGDAAGWRDRLERAVLASLRSVLAEPLDDLLLADGDGRPCIETVTTPDLERSLGMPGGHIFHGDLAWPFLDDGAPRDTPARRWGVATGHPRVLLCGAGAVRGGAASGATTPRWPCSAKRAEQSS